MSKEIHPLQKTVYKAGTCFGFRVPVCGFWVPVVCNASFFLCNVPVHYTTCLGRGGEGRHTMKKVVHYKKRWHITKNWYLKPANWYPKPETRKRRPQSGDQSGSRIYQLVGGGVTEFDVEFRFVKIQNSHWGGGVSRNLMLSSDLLKSKIPICRGGGEFMEFDVEFRFAKIQNSHLVEGGWLVEPISNFWCGVQIC